MTIEKTSFIVPQVLTQKGVAFSSQSQSILSVSQTVEKSLPLSKEQQETQDLIQRLEANKKTLSEQQKEAARRKVEQIKAKLEALRFLAASNPEAAAKEAARLARELAAASKQYANASGGGGGQLLSSPSQSATASSAGGVQNVSVSVVDAEGGAKGINVQTQVNVPNTSSNEKQTDDVFGQDDSITEGESEVDEQSEEYNLNTTSVRETLDKALQKAREERSEKEADDKFVSDVRAILASLKSIVSSLKRKGEDDDIDKGQDLKNAESAIKEIEKSLSDIALGGINATPQVSILV